MNDPLRSKFLPAVVFVSVLAVLTSSIWSVRYFLGQDSSAHLYASYVMLQLIKGQTHLSSVFTLNPVIVPNASGHWIMTLLLDLVNPETVTRLMLTGTLALFAASVLWLKDRVTGNSGGVLTVLFAFGIGLNWLWLTGTYNHVLGTTVFLVTVGLFYNWRDDMSIGRTAALAGILVLAFVSHLFTFLLLVGALILLALFSERRLRSVAAVAVAFLPALPLLLIYRRVSSEEGVPFVPGWDAVADPYSMMDWLKQFVWADPFILISRKTLPFLAIDSYWLLILSPIVLLSAAAGLLILGKGAGTHIKEILSDRRLPLALMCGGALVFAIVGPDHFGVQNGSLIRERLMIIGMALAALFFKTARPPITKILAGGLLSLLVVLQTLALWEYGLNSTKEVEPFVAAATAIPRGKTIASVVLIHGMQRFTPQPLAQVSSYVGVKADSVVWDDYEWRHYMFPAVTRDPKQRSFVFELTTSNVFYLNDPKDNFEEKLSRLESVLEKHNDQIEILLVYGSDDRINRVVSRWYSEVPIFTEGEVRVFPHKRNLDE